MIYFYVKKNGVLIEPNCSDSPDESFAWCVASVVKTLNYYSEPKRTSFAYASFISDMHKNSVTAKMLNTNNILKKFYAKYVSTGKLTASHVGKLILDIAKEHGYECYLGNKPPVEVTSEKITEKAPGESPKLKP